jgi:ERCC4-type nuclease
MLSSINDGRYKEQKKRMIDNYNDCIYIIENDNIFTKDNKLSSAYINMMIRDKITVLFASSIYDTIDIIFLIYNKLLESPDRFKKSQLEYVDCIKPKIKKIENIDKKTCLILQLSQIPTISTKLAKLISKDHNSMKDFIFFLNGFDNPNDYLENIPGIGSTKSKKIIDYLF